MTALRDTPRELVARGTGVPYMLLSGLACTAAETLSGLWNVWRAYSANARSIIRTVSGLSPCLKASRASRI